MTLYKYRAIVVVPEALADAINAEIAKSVDPGGINTFRLTASPSGDLPATHRYANSPLTKGGVEFMAKVASLFATAEAWVWVAHESGKKAKLEAIVGSVPNIHVEDGPVLLDDLLTGKSLIRTNSV